MMKFRFWSGSYEFGLISDDDFDPVISRAR